MKGSPVQGGKVGRLAAALWLMDDIPTSPGALFTCILSICPSFPSFPSFPFLAFPQTHANAARYTALKKLGRFSYRICLKIFLPQRSSRNPRSRWEKMSSDSIRR